MADIPFHSFELQQLVGFARDPHDDRHGGVLFVVDEPVAVLVDAEQRFFDAQLLLDRHAQPQELDAGLHERHHLFLSRLGQCWCFGHQKTSHKWREGSLNVAL